MKGEVKCPGCKAKLRYGSDLDGKPGICPACEQLVLPPEDAASDGPDEDDDPHAITAKPGKARALQKVLPIDARLEDVQWEGKSLARAHRIDLDEKLENEFDNKKKAEKELANLKRDLPLVESAYVPSGKLPGSALGLMVLGTWVAAGAALAAEVVVGIVAAIVIGILAALNVALAALGCIWCIAAILGVIVGLIAYAAPFFSGGLAAAWVTAYFGRLGKNRNMTAVALVSMLASALATFFLWLVFVFFAQDRLDHEIKADLGASSLHLIGHGLMGLGALIAVGTAWWMGRAMVQAAKFCEECEEFMDETALKTLGVGGIKATVQALADKNMPVAASMQCRGLTASRARQRCSPARTARPGTSSWRSSSTDITRIRTATRRT